LSFPKWEAEIRWHTGEYFEITDVFQDDTEFLLSSHDHDDKFVLLNYV